MVMIEDPPFHYLKIYINLNSMALDKIKCNGKTINKYMYELDLII